MHEAKKKERFAHAFFILIFKRGMIKIVKFSTKNRR